MTLSGSNSQRPRFRRWLPFVLVVIALLPRLCAVGRYITPDEPAWVYRSVQFREALLAGRWAETLVSGHPGATTTWLGALGISVQLALWPASEARYEWITHIAWLAPDNVAAFRHLAAFLTSGRLAVALATSFCVALVYVLTARLWGQRVALLGSALIALDPFVVGLTGLLHVDGLAAMLATLSLLALGLSYSSGVPVGRARWSATAGVFAALAVLSKSPAAALLPFSALAFLVLFVSGPGRAARWRDRLRYVFAPGILWCAAFALTVFLLMPALWVAPLHALRTVAGMAGRHAEEALRPVFFMGHAVLDPGPAFYPVALVFRLSPLVFAGIGVALLMLLRRNPTFRSPGALMLWAWLPVFFAVISVGGKKFDRYALPLIPALILLTALAGEALARHIGKWLPSMMVGIQLILLVVVLPFPLSAFNPLLGGAPVAEKVVPVGWGEEVSAAGRWLARQPGAKGLTAAATVTPALAPFFTGQTLVLDERQLPFVDYLVLTAGARQLDPAGYERLAAEGQLAHTIRFSGLDQAWIYVRPESTPLPTLQNLNEPPSFDRRVQLRAIKVNAATDCVEVYVRWALLQSGGRYMVQLTLRDRWDHHWGTLEVPLLNSAYFYPADWAPGEVTDLRYEIDLPPGVVPGDYIVELSVFDAITGSRLPLIGAGGAFEGVTFRADAVAVPAAAEPASAAALDIAHRQDRSWLDGALLLLGSSLPGEALSGGDLAVLTLLWQTNALLPSGVELEFTLGDDVRTILPLSRSPSEAWRPGDLFQERYSIPIPPLLAPGRYALRLAPVDRSELSPGRPAADLGQIQVQATERLFELPADIPLSLTVRADDSIELRGARLTAGQVRAGGRLDLILYWRALRQPDDDYTTFVHLVAPDGANLAQSDRWPANLPSHTWAPGQIVVDEISVPIPPEAAPGDYRVAGGLYQAASGLRLPLVTSNGEPVADDRLFLPATVEVLAP